MTQNRASMITTTMRAVVPRAPGGPDVLDVVTRDTPQPGRGEVLIATAFAGINRHDVGQRTRGAAPAGATDILGLEVSGTIVAAGEGVPQSRIGEEVCALVNGGGYAQYCIADAALTLRKPQHVSLRDSAALPEALFTGWFNVVELGRLERGAWLLVHGGTSGVGSLTIQIARHLGARVIATAGSDEKCAACRDFGAERAINYNTEDFVAVVQDATKGHGADVILDMVGGLYSERNLAALAKDGRVLHLFSGNVPVWSAPLRLIMEKRAIVSGSLMRPLEPERKQRVAAALIARVWPVLGTAIKPVIDSVYALEDVAEAHRRLESSRHIGKLLLSVTPKP
jgi:NADPH2:quinone reductase